MQKAKSAAGFDPAGNGPKNGQGNGAAALKIVV